MPTKKIHFFSGLILTVFVGMHIFNHLCSLAGADAHIYMMNALRLVYRNLWVECIVLLAVGVQIISGLTLFMANRKSATSHVDKLQHGTGLYLVIFFVIHVSAVLVGRHVLHLDTNFYFGVAGLNTFPFNLFFIPYYGFAILSFFGHIACIHHKKMQQDIFSLTPQKQSIAIFLLGICVTILLLYGLTNRFEGVQIPSAYHVLIGK